jgi:hypothetical protein
MGPGVFPESKRSEVDVDHWLQCRAEVKNEWSYTCAPPMRLHEVDILPFTEYKTDQVEFNINKLHRPVIHHIAQLILQALLLYFSRTWSTVTAVLYVRTLRISWFGRKSPARLMYTWPNEYIQIYVTIGCIKLDSLLWVLQCRAPGSIAGRVYSCLTLYNAVSFVTGKCMVSTSICKEFYAVQYSKHFGHPLDYLLTYLLHGAESFLRS